MSDPGASEPRFRFPGLRLSLILPTAVALAVALPLLWLLMTGVIEQGVSQRLDKQLSTLAPALAEIPDAERARLQQRIVELGAERQLRLTLVAVDGTVLADSARSSDQLERMDNHADRPEIAQALASGSGASSRRSATTGLDYVYTARTFTAAGGERRILRAAEELAELGPLKRSLARSLLIVLAVALVAMLAVSWWLQRRFTPPFFALAEGIQSLAAGNLEHRVEVGRGDRAFVAMAQSLNRMAERAQDQIAALEAQREYVEAVVDSMAEGVLVTDARGRTRLANPAFLGLFGACGGAVGKTPLELTREPRLESLVRETLSTGAAQVEQMDVETAPPRAIVFATSLLSDGSGAVIVARDVTDLVRLNRMRRDFVANVSHELKTPLTAIRGFAETLADGAVEDTEIARRFVERILGQSNRLQSLLDDLLTLSRLESPEATAEREGVDLAVIVRDGLESVRAPARERRIRLASKIAPECVLRGERESLERLVRNLLQNAVRYNREGGSVEVRLARRGSEIVLEVEDSGVGIPAADLDRVFERFYRVDQARSREEGGTGLGLAIVKHAAQLHGGGVEVESTLGRGSLFKVRLHGGAGGNGGP